MKKLLLFLLIPVFSFGQGRVWQRCGSPVNVPAKFLVNIDIMADTCGGATYKIIGGKWTVNTGLPASMGGEPGPKGDKGDTGPMGPQGGTGTMQFPFIVVVGTGNDKAAITAAFNENLSTKKPIYLIGNISAGDVVMNRRQFYLTIFMYGATWNVPQTATSAIKRLMPLNAKEAVDTFSHARPIIYGGTFIGYQHQVCLDLGASYCGAFRDIKFEGFKTAIHLRFALRTTIENCWAQNCLNGFMVDIGNWPGATYEDANAQSNQTTISNSRVDYQIPGGSGDVGIGVYGCSGVSIENCVIEGAKYKKVIDKNFLGCRNDKEFHVKNLHLEPIYGNTGAGTGEAYIYIRLVGVASIDGIYSQYTGCFIDAGGAGAEVTVDVCHVGWLVKDSNQKLFHNAGGAKFIFRANSYQSEIIPDKQADPTKPNYGGFLSGAELSRLFTGTPTTLYTGSTATQPPNTFILQ